MNDRDTMKEMAEGLRAFVEELRGAFTPPPSGDEEQEQEAPAQTPLLRELHVVCAVRASDRLRIGQAEDGTVVALIEDDSGPTSEILLTKRKVDRLISWLTDARNNMTDKGDDGAEVV